MSLSIADQCCDAEPPARRSRTSPSSSELPSQSESVVSNPSAIYEALALTLRHQPAEEYEVPSRERWMFNLDLCCELLEKEMEGHHLSPQLRSHMWRQLIRFAKAIKPDVATHLQTALEATNLPVPVAISEDRNSFTPCHCMDIPVAIIGYRYNGVVIGDVFANFEAARIFGYTMLEELRELLYQGEEMFFMKHLHPDICFEMWGMMMTRQERRMEHRSHMFDRNGVRSEMRLTHLVDFTQDGIPTSHTMYIVKI